MGKVISIVESVKLAEKNTKDNIKKTNKLIQDSIRIIDIITGNAGAGK